MQVEVFALAALVLAVVLPASPAAAAEVKYFNVPQGDHPHDVAPAPDGTVWYTGQRAGVLGRLNPDTGQVDRIPLGEGSAPHGVIIGPDGAAWITDCGLNAIVRVDPATHEVKTWKLPKDRAHAVLKFDPETKSFASFPSDKPDAAVRQLNGRPGEVWGAESGTDRLVVIRTGDKQAKD